MVNAARAGRTIGILTSGGDCAGLNAAIRAVVSRAVQGYGCNGAFELRGHAMDVLIQRLVSGFD